MISKIKCQRCNKELNKIDIMINQEESIKLCSICIIRKRTDLDRTVRSFKKDNEKLKKLKTRLK